VCALTALQGVPFKTQPNYNHELCGTKMKSQREAFSNDKEVPTGNRISGHRKYLSVKSSHPATKQLKLQPYRFQAVRQLQQRNMTARNQYCIGFVVLCVKGFICSSYGCVLNGTPCTSTPFCDTPCFCVCASCRSCLLTQCALWQCGY
jgi:hypothetical protein